MSTVHAKFFDSEMLSSIRTAAVLGVQQSFSPHPLLPPPLSPPHTHPSQSLPLYDVHSLNSQDGQELVEALSTLP